MKKELEATAAPYKRELLMDYNREQELLRRSLFALDRLRDLDIITGPGRNDHLYEDHEWRGFEYSSLKIFGEIVSDLNNRPFVRKYNDVLQMIVRRIRNLQEKQRYVQAERWNDLFNQLELVMMEVICA